jgi:beta-N-acetylhexosaminidase
MPARRVQDIIEALRNWTRIPLLFAANLDRGGDGVALEGTCFSTPLGVAATDDEAMAYRFGLVCGREASALGINWTFGPAVDIDFNYRNPITNTRTYGDDPDRVARLSRAYVRGVRECGIAVTLKHWPGDGVDFRDQHLLPSVNALSPSDWDATYGKVYRALIEDGAQCVMSAHILQPAYTRLLDPAVPREKVLPASLCPQLNEGLLRGRLGFNGLIVSDATSMAGMTAAMRREDAVPACIVAGCDMFLFTLDMEVDFKYMLRGVKSGKISARRLDEAVGRTLALKASLGLHRAEPRSAGVPRESTLKALGCAEHLEWARECADKSITLVKDTQGIVPIRSDSHKRILLFCLGEVPSDEGNIELLLSLLQAEGFVVTRFKNESGPGKEWDSPLWNDPIGYLSGYDLALYYARYPNASGQTAIRIKWQAPMGIDVPKFVHDIPTVFVSMDNPYLLQDVPMVKTYINAYSTNPATIRAVVEKLVGKSRFVGKSPVDPFCGLEDAAI